MRYLVCNFKNKLLKDDIIKYNRELGEVCAKKTRLVVCPPVLFLPFFDGNDYFLGGQDITSFMDKTITGEITGEQLKSMGVNYVIVGHSERRTNLREINIDFINKINNAQSCDIKIIYCIGENLKDREDGNIYNVLEKQISEVLNNISLKNLIIAYEPVWAIGTGKVPRTRDIKDAIEFIKDIIDEKYEVRFPVLYGGSVNEGNIEELLSINELDGFLVGGASLSAISVKNMLMKMEMEQGVD